MARNVQKESGPGGATNTVTRSLTDTEGRLVSKGTHHQPIEPGQRFGLWVTVQPDTDSTGKSRWICRCGCGVTRSIRADALRSGISQSCGCPRKKISQGMTFGRLTTISRSEDTHDGRSRWLCRCACGRDQIVRAANLLNGQAKSCGCYAREVNGRKGIPRTSEVGYRTAHKRVAASRGPASNHACIDCGAKAQEWSYDHSDPDEQVEVIKRFSMTYSIKVWHYDPRCVTCHRAHDGAAGFA